MKRVYIDTSVFVFLFVTKFNPFFSKKSKEFLQKVESGDYEALISLFAMMELVKQLRELMVKQGVCKKADWEENIKKAFEAIYKMQNVRIIEALTTTEGQLDKLALLTHSEIAWDGFNIMNKYPGSARPSDFNFVHDGIHPVDAIHIALAKKTGCSAIATFDRDFKETNPDIAPILLMEDRF